MLLLRGGGRQPAADSGGGCSRLRARLAVDRLAAGGDRGPGDGRPRRGRVLAGGLAARRARSSRAALPWSRWCSTAPRGCSSAPPGRSRERRWFPLRHAVLSLGRPGNQTRVILLSVGLGCFFVLGVRALQQNLIAESVIGVRQGSGGPLPHRHPARSGRGVRDVARQRGRRATRRRGSSRRCGRGSPACAARDVNLEGYADVRGRGSLGARVYGHLSRRPRAERGTRRPGSSGPAAALAADAEQEVSIEQSIHERFGINVGDQMRFDVVGRPFEARVTSVRRVRWEDCAQRRLHVRLPPRRARAGAAHVRRLRPRTGGAPMPARGCSTTSCRSYPECQRIDARDVIARIQTVVDNVVLAISVVGGIALASGVLILDRRRGDDEVPARLRGRDPAHARRQHAAARRRWWRSSTRRSACWPGSSARSGRSALSWAVTRYPASTSPGSPEPLLLVAGAAADDRARRRGRRAGERRSPAPEAARSAARRVGAAFRADP